jgi:hypothetical protein
LELSLHRGERRLLLSRHSLRRSQGLARASSRSRSAAFTMSTTEPPSAV